jgi:BirA family transcriptional regulator, biotin operon repressor / biotin---[acetyl-CoA-carboxylase] ligase
MSAPDRLERSELVSLLAPVRLASEVLVFQEVGSTNDVAAQKGKEGAPEGVVVFAETQTAGRGRLGRRWLSDPGLGLWFSTLLRPPLPPEAWMRLTTWAAAGAAQGIETAAGIEARIKWPNDILVHGRKVTGILIETHRSGEGGFAVAGFGVNVNQTTFPAEIASRTISLRQACGHSLDRHEVAVAILKALDAFYAKLEANFALILDEARRRSALIGREIELEYAGEQTSGVVVDLDTDGGLILRDRTAKLRHLHTGEVTLKSFA